MSTSYKEAIAIELTGTYRRTYLRDIKSGDTKFAFLPLEVTSYCDKYGQITCIGKIPYYSKGMPLRITGEFVNGNAQVYFKIDKIEEYVEHEPLLKQYLISNYKGINEKKADAILAFTGPDIFKFAKEENAEQILSSMVKGTSNIAMELMEGLRKEAIVQDIMNYIEPIGGLYDHALRLFSRHGNHGLKALIESPYTEGRYASMDTYLCDRVAKKSDILYYDKKRSIGFIMDIMKRYETQGHSCISSQELIRSAMSLSSSSCYENPIPYSCLYAAMVQLIEEKKLVKLQIKDELWIYKPELYKAEQAVAEQIKRLQKSSSHMPFDDEMIEKIEKKLKVSYNEGQKAAFSLLRRSGVKILTGPPGSGKTMTIRGLILGYQMMYPNRKIALAASTGRAAQVMSNATQLKSQTLYKLLEIRPFGDWEIQSKNENDPINADFIICDEVSMNGIVIMSLLLRAIKSNSTLLLVGDEDQLQSIDAGNVLHDLIHSDQLEVARLSQVMRQQTGEIYQNALKFKNGISNFKNDDTFVMKTFESEELLMRYIGKTIKKSSKTDYLHRQIISLTKVGICGTNAINKIYEGNDSNGILYGGVMYHLHDKVILNRTNYRKGYFNGDLGYIAYLDEEKITIRANNQDFILSRDEFFDMSLAEAVTAHKAQGSEFDYVYFVVSPQYKQMLNKRIIYTTMTRAKQRLEFLVCGDALKIALENGDSVRYSNLTSLLQNFG